MKEGINDHLISCLRLIESKPLIDNVGFQRD